MVRVLVSDIDTPQKYTDAYIQQVLVTAGIITDADFAFDYTYVYSISDLTITPDPVINNDFEFMSLVPLKAACLLTTGEFKQALGQGIKVRDGDSAIDTSVSFRGYSDILELGACKSYENLKWTLSASSGVGKAVLGPHRIPGGLALNTVSWYYDQFATGTTGRRDRS
jgi:hypothetical protein